MTHLQITILQQPLYTLTEPQQAQQVTDRGSGAPYRISGLLMGFAFAPFKYSFFLSYVLLVPFIDDIVSTKSFRG